MKPSRKPDLSSTQVGLCLLRRMDGSVSHRHFRHVFSGRLKELLPPLFLSLLLPPLFMAMDLLVKLFDRGIWHIHQWIYSIFLCFRTASFPVFEQLVLKVHWKDR